MSAPTTKIPWYLSWPVIVLSLVLWPLPLLLVFLRARKDRKLAIPVGKVVQIIGNLVGVFFLLVSLVGFSQPGADDKAFAVFLLLLALVSFYFARVGKRMAVKGKRLKLYLDLIVNQHILSIPELAQRIRRTEAEVQADALDMRESGYFRGLTIDAANRRLRIPVVEAQIEHLTATAQPQTAADPPAVSAYSEAPAEAEEEPDGDEADGHAQSSYRPAVQLSQRPTTKSCRCCGANNLVWPDREPICEFCGSII